MTVDIANLVLAVDDSGVKGAAQSVRDLGTAAKGATDAYASTNGAFTQFNDGLTATERAAAAAANETKRLQQNADALAAAARGATQTQLAFIEGLKQQAATAGKTTTELLRLRAAELGAADAAAPYIAAIEQATAATGRHSAGLGSNIAKMEIMRALHDAAIGSYTRMGSSLLVLGNATGWSTALFSVMGVAVGAVVAAVAGFLYLMGKGHDQMVEMNNALLMTSNYAGQTRTSMMQLAASMTRTHEVTISVANAVVTALVASGQIGSDAIGKVAKLASDYAKATGQDIEKIAPKLVAMFADPAKGAAEFDKQTHSLTTSQLELIRTFAELGMQEQVQDALAERMREHVPQQAENVGLMTKAVNLLAGAWAQAKQNIMDYGAVQTPGQKAQALRDQISEYKASGVPSTNPNRKAVQSALDLAEVAEATAKREAKAQGEATAAQIAHAGAWELVRQKSVAYQAQQLNLQRARVDGYQPEQGDNFAEQTRAKADALRVLDKQIRDASLAMGAEARTLANEQAASQLTTTENRLKDQARDIENLNRLGEISKEWAAVSLNENAQEVNAGKQNYEQRVLQYGGLTALEAQTHRDKLAHLKEEAALLAKEHTYLPEEAAHADFTGAAAGVAGQSMAHTATLDDQAKAQDRLTTAVGKTAQQQQALQAAYVAEEVAQKRSDANYLAGAASRATEGSAEQRLWTLMASLYNSEADAMERLSAAQGRTAAATRSEQQRVADMAKNFNELKATFTTIGDILTNAFTGARGALGDLFKSWAQNAEDQIVINQNLANSTRGMDATDPRAVAALADAERAMAASRLKSYGDMTGAAKNFFKENTTGYKVLEGAEKGFRAVELAMAIGNAIKKMALTSATTAAVVEAHVTETAAAIASVGPDVAASEAKGAAAATAGVAAQATGDPYTAFFRMAAMAATMAALGYAISGGAGGPAASSAEVQAKTQGTGTILGDAQAKSDSVAKALTNMSSNADLMLPLTAQMADSLRNIESGIGGVGALVGQNGGVGTGSNLNLGALGKASTKTAQTIEAVDWGVGGAELGSTFGPIGTAIGAVVGTVLGAVVGKFWGSSTSTVNNAGLSFGGTVGELAGGDGKVDQFANVHTSSSSWFGLSHSNSDKRTDAPADAQTAQQFALVFSSLHTALGAAATALGEDGKAVAAAVDAMVIPSTDITLMNADGTAMTADAISKQISAVVSAAMDNVAKAAFPNLGAFVQLGEGYAQTVIRMAASVEQAHAALDSLHVASVDVMTLSDKQGDVGVSLVKASLVAFETASTGVVSGVGQIVATLGGTVDDIKGVYMQLMALRTAMNDVNLNGGDLNQALIAGAGSPAALKDGLASYLDKYFTPAEKSAAQLRDLTASFAQLGLALPPNEAALRDLIEATGTATPEASKLTGSLLVLTGAFATAMDAAAALGNAPMSLADAQTQLQKNYDDTSASIKNNMTALASFSQGLRSLQASLNTGNLSSLTPDQQYTAASTTYQDTLSKARAGDTTAQGALASAAQTFLTASRTVNASDQNYQADFTSVQQALTSLVKDTDGKATVAQASLDALNAQVKGLVTIQAAVVSVHDAIVDLAAAMGSKGADVVAAADNGAIAALYQSILGRAADPVGALYWQTMLKAGVSIESMAESLRTSLEYHNLVTPTTSTTGTPATAGSHADGLTRVPRDGYTATLHADEAVVDAQSMGALRRYFGAPARPRELPMPRQTSAPVAGAAGAKLAGEVALLRAEVALLRVDNERQARAMIGANAAGHEAASNKVANAVGKTAKTAAWAAQARAKGALA